MPDEIEFRTKPQIALEQIDRALSNGVRVSAWTFDEAYSRDGKFLNGLGLDHYEVRGWRCVHRHFYVTQLSHLFCARVRQEYHNASDGEGDRITVEQVRSAMNVWLDAADLPPACQRKRFEEELEKQQYHQQRNKRARVSHTKTRTALLADLDINVKRIKSCLPGAASQ